MKRYTEPLTHMEHFVKERRRNMVKGVPSNHTGAAVSLELCQAVEMKDLVGNVVVEAIVVQGLLAHGTHHACLVE